MTEASYTAWDDKQYVWPPPDGWYEAPDGKWWPQGYGPPQVTEAPQAATAAASSAAIDNAADRVEQVADAATAEVGTVAAEAAGQGLYAGLADSAREAATGMNGWASDGANLDVASVADVDVPGIDIPDVDVPEVDFPDVDVSDVGGAAIGDVTNGIVDDVDRVSDFTGTTEMVTEVGELANGSVDVGRFDLADTGPIADAVDGIDTAADADPSAVVDGLAAAAPAVGQPAEDASTTIVGSESFDASTSAATEAFGTGLMPPMADRPAPAGIGADGELAAAFDDAGRGGAPSLDDVSPQGQAPVDSHMPQYTGDLAAAAPVTAPPQMDRVAEQQAILDAKPKGSSRGLLFAILGVVALLIIGAALFFAFGGDSDGDADSAAGETVATGPGSVSEPHPRVTGVVVFYPDAGVEQRWIVEVLEPVRDVSEEFENDGTQTLAATRLRVTNDSGVDGASLEDLRFNVVDASGAVIVRTDNTCPPGVEDFGYAASVPVEDSVEGTVCWAVPAGDLTGLMLGIESSKVQGRVHIQLQ